MRIYFKKRILLFLLILFWSYFIKASQGRQLASIPDREHDVIVLSGANLPAFLGHLVQDLCLYRYQQSTDQWIPIPFQVDERDLGWSYFIQPNGVLNERDELLFLSKDFGDSASTEFWSSDLESRQKARYQIEGVDPLTGQKGWAFLYVSTNLPTDPKMNIHYDPRQDRMDSDDYQITHGSHGFQSNILLKTSAGGDGLDFFDRQKLRLKVVIDLGILGTKNIVLKEEMDGNVTVVPNLVSIYIRARKKWVQTAGSGIIRQHRKMMMEFYAKGPSIQFEDSLAFISRFYPTFVEWEGHNITIPTFSQGRVALMRLSADLNENSTGMMFYNPYNIDGHRIDGYKETYNHRLDWPGNNWYLISADPSYPNAPLTRASIVTINNVMAHRCNVKTEMDSCTKAMAMVKYSLSFVLPKHYMSPKHQLFLKISKLGGHDHVNQEYS